MAKIVNNEKYVYTFRERMVESVLYQKLVKYTFPEIEFVKEENNFLSFYMDILKAGRKKFYIKSGGLKKYELLSCHKESFQNYMENGHCYILPDIPIKKGDIVVDCGGCEGFFAWYALGSGAAKVIIIEPEIKMIEGLKKTFEEEILKGRVIIISKGLDKEKGMSMLMVDENMYCSSNFGYLKLKDNMTSVETNVDTLDNIINSLDVEKVDVIKMDIEGGEMDALLGAEQIISRDQPRMMIATYHGYRNAILCRNIVCNYNHDYSVNVRGYYAFEKPARPYMTVFF